MVKNVRVQNRPSRQRRNELNRVHTFAKNKKYRSNEPHDTVALGKSAFTAPVESVNIASPHAASPFSFVLSMGPNFSSSFFLAICEAEAGSPLKPWKPTLSPTGASPASKSLITEWSELQAQRTMPGEIVAGGCCSEEAL